MSQRSDEVKGRVRYETYNHGQVVAPGQEEHTRVVLLPVGRVECEEDVPQDEVVADRRHGVVRVAAKDGVETGGDEHCSPRV